VKLKRIDSIAIIPKSPERVIGFPPFGGLFLMARSWIIKPSEKQQPGKQFNHSTNSKQEEKS
jgi:hypothetical protein